MPPSPLSSLAPSNGHYSEPSPEAVPSESLSTGVDAKKTALPRASDRPLNNSSDPGDGTSFTSSISFTISKDSSADQCVIEAKLLADMGERSHRNHKVNETQLGHSIANRSEDSVSDIERELWSMMRGT
jgi:hypothetical protein